MFSVGDGVMARWPGSRLFYNAKVQLVREEDTEYDVEYENGSVFTIAAKDVMKKSGSSFKRAVPAARSKSKSRARSAGRRKKSETTPKKVAEVLYDSSADESLTDLITKKASNSSRTSRRSINKVSASAVKLSTSSRVSSKSVANTSVTDNFSEDDTDDLGGLLSVSARASRSSKLADDTETELELLATDQTQLVEEAELTTGAASARASISSRISSLIFGAATPVKVSTGSVVETADTTSPQPDTEEKVKEVSQNGSAKTSASSKKASTSSRVSKRASASSNISTTEENKEPDSDITEEIAAIKEKIPTEALVEKASISSRISGILFGGTPKASTSSKVSEKAVEETPEGAMNMEDLAAAEVSAFPYISNRRSSRASTRASTKATNSSLRQSPDTSRSAGLDEFSEDEEKVQAIEEPAAAEEKSATAAPGGWSVEWVWALFFMVLCPMILVTLHTLCTGHSCGLAMPGLSLDPR